MNSSSSVLTIPTITKGTARWETLYQGNGFIVTLKLLHILGHLLILTKGALVSEAKYQPIREPKKHS